MHQTVSELCYTAILQLSVQFSSSLTQLQQVDIIICMQVVLAQIDGAGQRGRAVFRDEYVR